MMKHGILVRGASALVLAVAYLTPACLDADGGGAAVWLPAAGRSADWVKATAKCRELLGKLKPDDPLAKTHLVKIKSD